MARQLAKNAQVIIVEHGATLPTPLVCVGGLSSWSLDESKTEVDTTGIYDKNKQYVPGQGEARGDFEAIYDTSDETQAIIEEAHANDLLVDIYIRLQGTGAGLPQKKIQAYISKYTYSASVDDKVSLSLSYVAGADIDNTPQPTPPTGD